VPREEVVVALVRNFNPILFQHVQNARMAKETGFKKVVSRLVDLVLCFEWREEVDGMFSPGFDHCSRIVLEDREEVSDEGKYAEGEDVEVDLLCRGQDCRAHCQLLEAHGESDKVKESLFTEELDAEECKSRVDGVHIPDSVVPLLQTPKQICKYLATIFLGEQNVSSTAGLSNYTV